MKHVAFHWMELLKRQLFPNKLNDSYSAERIKVANLLLKTLAVMAPVVAVIDYQNGHLVTAIFALSLSFAIPLLIYVSRQPKYRELPVFGLICVLLILFISYVLLTPLPAEKLVWMPLYAVGFYFVSGKKSGTILSVIALLVLVVHFVLHPWLSHMPILISQMGETLGAVLFAMIISYSYENIRSRHEQELRELAKQAEAASQAKSEFLSNMSHEIRTPMNSVLGLTYLALKSVEDDKQRDYLEKIRFSGEHMLSTIDDILDFSKIEAGMMRVDTNDFDLTRLLHNLINQLSWRAKEKGLLFRLEIDMDVPQYIHGDAFRLNQILLNLLSNAIKFTEQGKVIMRVRMIKTLNNVHRLRFEIQDSGLGIADAQQACLFQPFHQVDSSATRKAGGTGLGLAISKQLVALMNGEIGVESRLSAGSTFWISLPLHSSDKISAQDDVVTVLASSNTGSGIVGSRILLVENNELNQQVAKELLEQFGASIVIAFDGQQALDVLEKETFDCVLMDMQMPVMDGMEATRRIRANPRLSGSIIIAMTASASREDRERCMDAGMDDFISKPIRPDILYTVLAQHLSGSASVASEEAALSSTAILADNPPIYDLVRMSKTFGLGKEKLHQFLERFFDSMKTSLHEFDNALQKNDTQALLALVHDMKASASLVDAKNLLELCFDLERAAKQEKDATELQEIVSQFHAILKRMEQEVIAEKT